MTAADTGPDGKIYISDDLDKVVLTALDAGGDAREPAMQAVYDWISANTAACPLVVSQRIWAVNPRVMGFGLPATDYDLPFKGIALG